MPDRDQDSRILAIDLRARKFGYAMFEGPTQLIDWGSSTYPSGDIGARIPGQRVAVFLRLFHPSVVVIKKDRRNGVRKTPVIEEIMKHIAHETDCRSIPIVLMNHRAITQAFPANRVQTKHEVAEMITTIFPELRWKLPPKRKAWQAEHRRMGTFDAIAVGLAFLNMREP